MVSVHGPIVDDVASLNRVDEIEFIPESFDFAQSTDCSLGIYRSNLRKNRLDRAHGTDDGWHETDSLAGDDDRFLRDVGECGLSVGEYQNAGTTVSCDFGNRCDEGA